MMSMMVMRKNRMMTRVKRGRLRKNRRRMVLTVTITIPNQSGRRRQYFK